MAKNKVFDDTILSVVCSDPAAPNSGDPVRVGSFTGVAITDEGDGGNAATNTSVDFGVGVWDLSVKGVDDGGNSAVAVGDAIYYVDADTPKLSKKSSGYFFGIALETVNAGATATINVLKLPPGFTQIADGILNGVKLANVANANVVGGIPVLHRIDIADAATGDVDTVLTHKTRVLDVWAVKTGAAGGAANTVQAKNGANAITNALDINVNDQTVVRAGTIDDAQHEIAAGGTLKITRTKAGGNAACTVYVLGVRVA
ncbi:MAG: DUF2190 family protein [Bacillota bacterium]|nr:MAG: DUF2190 family protein [Bacillota bacterium]